MKSVASILKAKADQTIYTIAPTASVFDAVKLMAEKNIGALVVMEGEKIVGIVSDITQRRRAQVALQRVGGQEVAQGDIVHIGEEVHHVHLVIGLQAAQRGAILAEVFLP